MKNGEKPISPTTKANYDCQPHLAIVGHGLTKREYFAGLAMSGMVSCGYVSNKQDESTKRTARLAVEFADALLAELEKTQS